MLNEGKIVESQTFPFSCSTVVYGRSMEFKRFLSKLGNAPRNGDFGEEPNATNKYNGRYVIDTKGRRREKHIL